jgi:hypothetical protein
MRSQGSDQRITRRESMRLERPSPQASLARSPDFLRIFHPVVERLRVFVRVCALATGLCTRMRFWCAGTDKPELVCIQDYNQWDKFVHKDLDKILDDFDENDRQEQEETHR